MPSSAYPARASAISSRVPRIARSGAFGFAPSKTTEMPAVRTSVAGSRPASSSAWRRSARRVRRTSASSGTPYHALFHRVGVPGHQAEHARLLARDQDRWATGADRPRQQLEVLRAVVSALEAHALTTQERHEDLASLLETSDAVVERVSEGVELGLVPAAADAQDQPPAADLVELRRHLRGQRRVAEGKGQHEWPELDARGDRGDGREDGPRLVDALGGAVVAEDEVVGAPHRVEAIHLGRQRHLAQLVESARLVRAERQHQSDLHVAHASGARASGTSTLPA